MMIGNELIPALWQGGKYGYYFTLPKRITYWRSITNPNSPPEEDTHIYFGVHPTKDKVSGRASVQDIACINCLFAEFDNKDFGGEAATLDQINKSPVTPSVIISSGGGFHVYWLLKDTFYVQDEENRQRIKSIQSRWVDMLDADPGAKDLARILRVPGTIINKYSPPREVEICKIDVDIRYDIDLLEELLPELLLQGSTSISHNTPDCKKVQDALDRLDPWRCDEYHSWIKVGMALQELGGDGLALWNQWSKHSSKYKPGDCEKRWESFKSSGVTLGSLFYWADHDHPISIPEPTPSYENESPGQSIELDEPQSRTSWTVADLLDTEFPEPRWAIPGIIPEGFTIFGGRPKVGKSWLMLQAAWAVGSGGRFLGQEVERGKVFYLALEDSPRRLQDRVKSMGVGRDALITFENNWRPMQSGGLDDLVIQLERNYRMVIVDTLTRSIPGINQRQDVGVVGKIFDDIHRLAMNRQTAIVLIDHTRKPSGVAADPVDDILHTTEKTAIADCIIALYKRQGKEGAILRGSGRDLKGIELSLIWHSPTRCWQIETPDLTENFDDILDTLDVLGKAQLGDIVNATGQPKGNVFNRLKRLAELELVEREKVGRNVFYSRVRSE